MSQSWMIRAGEGGHLIDDFAKGFAAIGWRSLGDLTKTPQREAIRALYACAYANEKPGKESNAIAMIFKFRTTLQSGHNVVTYDPTKREYLVGTIESDYFFDTSVMEGYPHLRKVAWTGRVSRDLLTVSARNSLGGALTLFGIDDDAWGSIEDALSGKPSSSDRPSKDEKVQLEETREDAIAKAHELIKDQVLRFDDSDLEYLTAALLRAMGYRTRVTPKGPDRGVDVFASPDGLGFQEPRIKTEVKHRAKTPMGAPDIRSFIGGLRDGERGLYVSTGGFTKEARYEADRSKVPVTLLDIDELVSAIVTHYDSFDSDGRALLPLVRVYWPAASG